MTMKDSDMSHQGDDEQRGRLARIDAFYDWIYRRGLARLAERGSLTQMGRQSPPHHKSDGTKPP
jgi:hypothetical protein